MRLPAALRRHRLIAGAALALVLVGLLADRLVDEPVRRWVEREGNARLQGYSLRIGGADFRPWLLSGTLFDVELIQQAHPEEPVARLTAASVDVDWGALLRGRVVADLDLVRPLLRVDTRQLGAEWQDEVPVEDKGWQQLWELYPLEVNRFTIADGAVTYLDTAAQRSLRLTGMELVAENIRHVIAGDSRYPSAVRLRSVVFGKGSLELSGSADLLRRPHPAFDVVAGIEGLPLDALGPVVDDYRIRLRGGVLGARGQFEVTPERYVASLQSLDIRGLAADYVSGPVTERIRRARRAVAEAARRATRSPEVRVRSQRFTVTGEFGYVSSTEPRYRIHLDDARLRLTNFSNRARQGESHLAVDGLFMGSGALRLRGVIRPGPGPADFVTDTRIGRTDLRRLNPLLRAHGRIDVSSGTLALFSQVQVRDGRVRGYVKPLLRDVEIYDEQADADKGFFRKLYEKIAEEVLEILENEPRGEVAGIVDLSGPLEDPHASAWQIALTLLRNAFIEAILPGFEPARAPPGDEAPGAAAGRPAGTPAHGMRHDPAGGSGSPGA